MQFSLQIGDFVDAMLTKYEFSGDIDVEIATKIKILHPLSAIIIKKRRGWYWNVRMAQADSGNR